MRGQTRCLKTFAAAISALLTAAAIATLLPQPADYVAYAQEPQGQADTAALAVESEQGIPIRDALVHKSCATCHTVNDKQQMSRISFQRKTPEGWQTTVRRMAALNGMEIEPQTARDVVKYLSNNLGLAPEELRILREHAPAPRPDIGQPHIVLRKVVEVRIMQFDFQAQEGQGHGQRVPEISIKEIDHAAVRMGSKLRTCASSAALTP